MFNCLVFASHNMSLVCVWDDVPDILNSCCKSSKVYLSVIYNTAQHYYTSFIFSSRSKLCPCLNLVFWFFNILIALPHLKSLFFLLYFNHTDICYKSDSNEKKAPHGHPCHYISLNDDKWVHWCWLPYRVLSFSVLESNVDFSFLCFHMQWTWKKWSRFLSINEAVLSY